MQNKHLSREIDSAKNSVENVFDDCIQEIENLEIEIDNLKERVEQLQKENDELKEQVQQLNEDIRSHQ